jgi:hypothetical protein
MEAALPYTITSGPRNPIPGTRETTVSKETAAEAWALVQKLEDSDQWTVVKDLSGRGISWQELRDRAAKGAN